MTFRKAFSGSLQVILTGADVHMTLKKIAQTGISVYQMVEMDPLTVRFWMFRSDYRSLLSITEKKGDSVTIERKSGIYWTARRILKRPVLTAGCALILMLLMFLPSRILFVEVTGNERIPDAWILQQAENCGIFFGVSRRNIRSEQVKNALLQRIPELKWVGVNTKGCTAIISVSEREDSPKVNDLLAISSVVAVRDGVITDASAVAGTLMCKAGQAVTKGQVLISGYTDSGHKVRGMRAEGEVYGKTSYTLEAITPSSHLVRENASGSKRQYTLILGKNRIKIWPDSGNFGPGCGRMYEEYYIDLPGGYRLPFGIRVDRYHFYVLKPERKDQDLVKGELGSWMKQYLLTQMVAGTVLQDEGTFFADNGVFRMKGLYLCREMIGRSRQEEIGEQNSAWNES